MVLKKPTIEFVNIELNGFATYSASQNCPEDALYIGGTPSMETCDGPDAPSNNCIKYNFTVMN